MDSVIEQNILAIQQLDLSIGKEDLAELLRTRSVALILCDGEPAHKIALRTAANLLSRLSFQVSIGGDDDSLELAITEADQFGFNFDRFEEEIHYDLRITIGAQGAVSDIQAYAFGWNVCLTSNSAQNFTVEPSNEVCGAMLGVLIASEAFNRTVGPALGKKEFQPNLCISLLDYSSSISSGPAPLPSLHIPRATLIGCGAIGNAFAYALSLLPGVTGYLEIVDPDWFTRTNSHRYMLANINVAEHPRVYKTIRAAEFLAHHRELKVQGYEKNFEQFLAEDGDDRRVSFLIAAVDNHAKRRQLGRETPREAINASTGNFTLVVSTHYGVYSQQGAPCAGCHYPYQAAEAERHTLIARETGLSPAEVESLSTSNAPMTEQLLQTIAAFRGLPSGTYAEFEGQPFDSFYQHGICGGTEVVTSTGKAEIPLAHVSAAAGILLALELTKRFTPELRQYALDNFLQLDMLNLTSEWFRKTKIAREDCDCRRQVYQRRFSNKYSQAMPDAPR